MIEFILARYNYWIVILLMMTGLYIVFSRGNLVKTIIGLNIFQTSVFFLYITMGKIIGGTAPILVAGADEADHTPTPHDGAHASPAADHATGPSHADTPSAGHGAEPLSADDAAAYVEGGKANALPDHGSGAESPGQNLHSMPEVDGTSNTLFDPNLPAAPTASLSSGPASDPGPGIDVVVGHGGDIEAAAHGQGTVVDAMTGAINGTIYSNPVPHVLILTAIVVGVATTAVGLALAIRIREAYGTIEEDALEQTNNEAEFGQRGEPGQVAS